MRVGWANTRTVAASVGAIFAGLALAWFVIQPFRSASEPQEPVVTGGRPPQVIAKNLFPDLKRFKDVPIRVVDAASGEFITDFAAAGPPVGESPPVQAAGGVFKLDGEFMDNEYLRIDAPEYHRALVSFGSVPPDGCTVPVFPEGRLSVRCLAWGGSPPIQGAFVTIDQPGLQPVSALSGADGWAELKGFSLQSSSDPSKPLRFGLRVTVRADRYMPKQAQILVEGGTDWRKIDVQLPRAELIDVKVVAAETEMGVPGARLVHNWDFGGMGRVNDFEEVLETDGDGRLALAVPEGATRLEIACDHPDYAFAGTELKRLDDRKRLGERGRLEVVLTLERGYAVDGIVLDERDHPIAKAMVDIDPVQREELTAWMRFVAHRYFGGFPDAAVTDAEGIFQLKRIPAGDYRVTPTRRERYPDPSNPLLAVGPGENLWAGVMKEGITIDGIAETPEGRGVPGVHVSFLREERPGVIAKGFSRDVEAEADGAFEVRGLAPGPYSVTLVASSGLAPLRLDLDPAAGHRSPWRFVMRESVPKTANGKASREEGGR